MFDRLFETLLERPRRFPAERRHLARIECVPLVVAGAILDEIDEGFGCSHGIEHRPSDVEVRPLVTAADVVYLTGRSLVENHPDRATVVLYVGPLANVRPVAIDRERLPACRAVDE